MSRFLKVGLVLIAAGVVAPSFAWAAEKKADAASAEASDSSAPRDRTFEETREFMKKHSEESKRTGKM